MAQERLFKQLLVGNLENRKRKGRLRKRWFQKVEEDLRDRNWGRNQRSPRSVRLRTKEVSPNGTVTSTSTCCWPSYCFYEVVVEVTSNKKLSTHCILFSSAQQHTIIPPTVTWRWFLRRLLRTTFPVNDRPRWRQLVEVDRCPRHSGPDVDCSCWVTSAPCCHLPPEVRVPCSSSTSFGGFETRF